MNIYPLVLATHNAGKVKELQKWLDDLIIQPHFRLIVENIQHLAPCPEPHDTFLENAIAKAKYAALHTGKLSLADDSGLCIPLLNEAPGVVSADFSDHFENFVARYHFDQNLNSYANLCANLHANHLTFAEFAQAKENQNPDFAHIKANDLKHQYHIYCLIQALKYICRSEDTPLDFLNFKTPAYYQCSLVLAPPNSPNLYIAQAKWQVEFRIQGYQGEKSTGFGYDSHIYIPELDCYVCELSTEAKNKISHRGQALQKMGELLLEYIAQNSQMILLADLK